VPELPEIEHLKRSLEPVLVGARVRGASLIRRDVLRLPPDDADGCSHCSRSARLNAATTTRLLLGNTCIRELRRHGKQLAVVSDAGRLLCIHLGMSGQLRFVPNRTAHWARDHVHCTWTLDSPAGPGMLIFRDPRRFGGLWAYDTWHSLQSHRWDSLGPDSLNLTAESLAKAIEGSARSIKAALLDQSLIAGVGNIYADESLFRARIHPQTPGRNLREPAIIALAAAIRDVLTSAVQSGGSTVRSYMDANGRPGEFIHSHLVYGRAGRPCATCGKPLKATTIAHRTTVFCRSCQTRTGIVCQ